MAHAPEPLGPATRLPAAAAVMAFVIALARSGVTPAPEALALARHPGKPVIVLAAAAGARWGRVRRG